MCLLGTGALANSEMHPIEVLPGWPQAQPHNPHLCFQGLKISGLKISVHVSSHTHPSAMLHWAHLQPLWRMSASPSNSHPLFPRAAFSPPDSQAKVWLRSCLLVPDNFYCQPRSSNSSSPYGGEGIQLRKGLCDGLLGTVERHCLFF